MPVIACPQPERVMLYSHQQWGEVIAEEDSTYRVGFLGYMAEPANPALSSCCMQQQ